MALGFPLLNISWICLSLSVSLRLLPSPSLFPKVMMLAVQPPITPLPSPSYNTPANFSWGGIGCQM